jgi:hypothetical protein
MSKHYRPRYRVERSDTTVIPINTAGEARSEQAWWVVETTDPDADPHGPFASHGAALAFALCKARKAKHVTDSEAA